MRTRTLALNASLLLINALAFAAAPDPAGDVDYGQMYVVQKKEAKYGEWQGGANYTYGFSNPYTHIHGLQMNFSKQIGQYFTFGVSPTIYMNSRKAIANQITNDLKAQNIQTEIFEPEHSAHAMLTIIPLSGMLNWFNTSAVDFDFAFSVGGGLTHYKQRGGYLPSVRVAVAPQVMVSRNMGATIGVQSNFDRFATDDWQSRFETMIGVFGRF